MLVQKLREQLADTIISTFTEDCKRILEIAVFLFCLHKILPVQEAIRISS